MATSSTYNFAPDNASLLEEAFERVGIRPSAITGEHIRSALVSMNLMMIQWINEGFKEYQFESITLNSTDYASEYIVGGGSFALPARVLHIFTATYKTGTTETPMHFVGRMDYNYIHDKTIQSNKPDRYFFNRTISGPTLYIWPTLASDSDSIVLSTLTRHQDVGSMTDNPPVHFLWYDAFAAGLAARLAEKYAPDREDKLLTKASGAYKLAQSGGRAFGSTIIKPNFKRGNR